MKKNIFIVMFMIIFLLTSCAYTANNNNTDVENTSLPTESTESYTTEVATESSIATEPTEYIFDPSNITYPIEYSDSSCKITINNELFENNWCYIAHLEFTDYNRFGSALANDALWGYETTSNAAERLGAIFCVNGAYMNGSYAIVRDGNVFCDINIVDKLAIYNSNNGILANADSLGITGKLVSEAVKDKEVTDTFQFFNTTIVKDGNNVTNINDTGRAQRTFMGTTGNSGDIYIVVSEGRYVDGVSVGFTLNECANLLLRLGCTYGINLDGGGSSTMVWYGTVLNSAKKVQRPVIDFVYFK